MHNTVSQTTRGVASFVLMVAYTLVLMIPITLLAVGKLLSPARAVRDVFSRLLNRVVEAWVGLNSRLVSLGRRGMWNVEIPPGLFQRPPVDAGQFDLLAFDFKVQCLITS